MPCRSGCRDVHDSFRFERGGDAGRIIEAGNRLNMAGMFASLILLSLLGIAIFFVLNWVQQLLLDRRAPRLVLQLAELTQQTALRDGLRPTRLDAG